MSPKAHAHRTAAGNSLIVNTGAGGAPGADAEPATRGYLSFRLGREEYGIDILQVQEIRSYSEPTRIAGAPDFLRGVLELRGFIVPVIDLRLRFGLAEISMDRDAVIIVLNVARRVIGIVVDAVSDVVQLCPENLRKAPEFYGALDGDFVDALVSLPAQDGERLLIVANVERLLTSPSLGLVNSSLAAEH